MSRRAKTCYCHNCDKFFSYLGIAMHRKSHISKGQAVGITYTDGSTYTHFPFKSGHED